MKPRQQGFTLLEIMIVLSVLGVLLALVGSVLVGTQKALLKAQRYTTSLDEIHAAQQFLRTSLAQVLPMQIKLEGRDRAGIFYGSAQRLTFVASLPGQLGGGIRRYSLALHDAADEHNLQVSFAQLSKTDDGTAYQPWGQPQVLIPGVRQLRFAYRGTTPEGQPTGWLSEWPWPRRLPRLVRIECQNNGPVPWVTEVLALRLDLASGANL
ncbi:prepilin-type N-terminal cleavage/methylation domain-containing protein [Pseudomonas helleri]|uniref:prepilin-type N-terminal cleavage/methylation domain-containing protein n=1 Tax=Pseudomonas helleri TaxID=1608996 RepID=UPI0030DCAB7D